MAAVKKLIEFARELHLENVAKVLESAYVDDCNSSVATIKELEEIKKGNAWVYAWSWNAHKDTCMDRWGHSSRALS